MKQTTNYALNCYELTDAADLRKLTPNFEAIDTELKEHQDTITNHEERVTTAETSVSDHENRINNLETRSIVRTVIADTKFIKGSTLTLAISLIPQYIRIMTYIENAGANTDAALDASISMTDNTTAFREYIIEIFSQNENLKFRRIKDVDTSDHPFNVSVTSSGNLVIYSNHPDHNHILIVSEKMI